MYNSQVFSYIVMLSLSLSTTAEGLLNCVNPCMCFDIYSYFKCMSLDVYSPASKKEIKYFVTDIAIHVAEFVEKLIAYSTSRG